jgi:DNA-binding NarL/FixJ family response regulator
MRPLSLRRIKRVAEKMDVLIIDDNATARGQIRTIVEALTDAVHECSDGDQARDAYLQYRPDYVLMDLSMARVGGLAATRQIMAVDDAARVIIVTHHDEADLREASRAAGAYGYVLKENLPELLLLMSHRILRPPVA